MLGLLMFYYHIACIVSVCGYINLLLETPFIQRHVFFYPLICAIACIPSQFRLKFNLSSLSQDTAQLIVKLPIIYNIIPGASAALAFLDNQKNLTITPFQSLKQTPFFPYVSCQICHTNQWISRWQGFYQDCVGRRNGLRAIFMLYI